ncbi:MAG: hypothetical protein GX608_06625 [Lentisphaerae bacterium]|nr:hypothetical protein [Lentisphaerota bacterium]
MNRQMPGFNGFRGGGFGHLAPALAAGLCLAAAPGAGFAGDALFFKDCAGLPAGAVAPFEVADRLQLALTDNPAAALDHYALGLRLLGALRRPPPDCALAPETGVFCDIVVRMSVAADWRARLTAAELAGALPVPQLAVPMAALAYDPEWPVRQRAIMALGRIGSARSLETLAAVLAMSGEGHWFERESAVQAMGECNNMPGLLAALSDTSEEVRRMAVRHLARQPRFDAKARGAIERARSRETNRTIKAELKSLLDGNHE